MRKQSNSGKGRQRYPVAVQQQRQTATSSNSKGRLVQGHHYVATGETPGHHYVEKASYEEISKEDLK
ncbi:hypothetical protein TNCT_215701 [Trichonephila clavata]|uniref:Uncharacterized protein n=1 Tax=Trichonephila clavata TaxID=2740835 RepID=A0A8X6FEA3_TRICU|nr:hypothetical protein TNCT_215701 [Trichonephila clavata]